MDCEGYRELEAAVVRDEPSGDHDYRGKLAWVVERAKHYAEKTGLSAESILDAWEKRRDYWYMNYYQDGNQPLIKADSVRVFETVALLMQSVGGPGFRCPMCQGVSTDAYVCDSGLDMEPGKTCDWKVYGLFGHLGRGISVFVKDRVRIDTIFMPVAWEAAAVESGDVSREKAGAK